MNKKYNKLIKENKNKENVNEPNNDYDKLKEENDINKNEIDRLKSDNDDLNDKYNKLKEEKEEHFEKEIKNIIKEVMSTHIDVKLDPMNSYNRRIVHNLVSSYDNLTTESIGEEPNRYTIIKYRED